MELCLKLYSPLAVVLWFTLTQHEETSWARRDGLKERKRPWEMDQKTCEWEEKNKRVVKTWFPDWYCTAFGLCESKSVLPFVLFSHCISLRYTIEKTQHVICCPESSPPLPNKVGRFIDVSRYLRRQEITGDNAKIKPVFSNKAFQSGWNCYQIENDSLKILWGTTIHVQTHTHKGTCTYTSTNTHAHQIGSRHMGQSVPQPAELTNCMLKIVTHVGGSRTPRRRTTAWLCRRAADQTDVCILPSTKKKVQYLGMLQSWFLVLTKCPTSQQTNTALLNQQCLVHGYMKHTSHP